MIQEFLLEIIQDMSFFERVETKKGTAKRFRYREESVFFKLRKRTIKSIQKEIGLIIKKHGTSVVDWRVYTSLPFE